jgi:twitching motility protein PilT
VVISIEDPIEYIFTNNLCRVKQREIGTDTKSFAEALRHVLRQDPDVILISEMRDLETIAAAITAAETGHLVLATLHTIDAPKAIDRIVDAFPPDQQNQIISQLANALQAIIAQRLLPKADHSGRVACTEVMVMNDGIRALMRDRRFQQVLSMIEIGAKDGMITFDESVTNLFLSGQITKEEAILNARDPSRVTRLAAPAPVPAKKGIFG